MDNDTAALVLKLIELLQNKDDDMTTPETFQQSAARFNERAAFTANESQQAFVQQNAAQFAQLLSMQNQSKKKDH